MIRVILQSSIFNHQCSSHEGPLLDWVQKYEKNTKLPNSSLKKCLITPKISVREAAPVSLHLIYYYILRHYIKKDVEATRLPHPLFIPKRSRLYPFMIEDLFVREDHEGHEVPPCDASPCQPYNSCIALES